MSVPLSHRIEAAVYGGMRALTRPLSHSAQLRLGALLGRSAFALVPGLWRRSKDSVDLIYSDQPEPWRRDLVRRMSVNVGRSLIELMHAEALLERAKDALVTGPGLSALQEAQAQGKGALLLSGHFGQWEIIRGALKSRGIEVGCIYRPFNNRAYDAAFQAEIEQIGQPVLHKGRPGMRALVKHLRGGGAMALLHDQRVYRGADLTFMNRPALTALTAAELGLKFGVPVIPCYGLRDEADPSKVGVILEAPIPQTDAVTMTQALNDSLERQVRAHPDQWFWLHRRWKHRKKDPGVT
ncbi:MAG: lysophospholipid acyltransferase family protein [Pseudomonadota bacterium]